MPYSDTGMLPENINQFQQKLKKIRLQERKYIPEPFFTILQAFFMPLISCLCESWIIDLIKTTLQPERCCNICQALGFFFSRYKQDGSRERNTLHTCMGWVCPLASDTVVKSLC